MTVISDDDDKLESSFALYSEAHPYKTVRNNNVTPAFTENQVLETEMKLQVNETNVKLITKNGCAASSYNDYSEVVHRYLDASDDIQSNENKKSVLASYVDIHIED